jgi:hypothetical protein
VFVVVPVFVVDTDLLAVLVVVALFVVDTD